MFHVEHTPQGASGGGKTPQQAAAAPESPAVRACALCGLLIVPCGIETQFSRTLSYSVKLLIVPCGIETLFFLLYDI